MKRTYALVGSVCLLIALTARGETIYFDNFQQFPSGTDLTVTNYVPPAGASAGFHAPEESPPAATTVVASNFLGSTRAFFNPATPPYQHSYEGDALASLTNRIVTLTWNLWIAAVKTPPTTLGGLAVNLATTNLFISGNQTNLETNPLLIFGDAGQVAVFTNTPSVEDPLAHLVSVGSWSNRVGTVMTNQLVLNFPSGTFSFSINSTTLTSMPIPAFLTNIFNRFGLDVFEGFTNAAFASTGNRFALDDVRIDTALTSTNQDVRSYLAAAKGQEFLQLTSSAPSLITTGFIFVAEVEATATNSVLGASVELPGGATKTLAQESPDEVFFQHEDAFTNKAGLDAVYTSGVYALSINAANQGLLLAPLNLPADAYPATTPHISNFTAAQTVDSAANFTLTWDAFSGGTASDFIVVDIDSSTGGGFSTPDFDEPGALDGTATSLIISNNTLQAGTTYEGRLLFIKIMTSDTNSIPGATGVTAYFKQTVFNLVTSGVLTGVDIAVSQIVSTNAVTIGDTFSYTITITNRGTETATSVVGSNDTTNVSIVGISGCESPGQCDLGSLAAGASTSVVLTVTSTGAGQACNTSSASVNEADVNPANNSSTVCIPASAPNIAPTANCRNVTNIANAGCQAIVTTNQVDNGSIDTDGTITNRTLNPASPYPLGDTVVTYTVTDNNGASDSCSATITVLDQTLPTVTCPGTIISNVAAGVSNVVVNFSSTFSDNCSLVVSNCTPGSGSSFAVGTNAVTCLAVDGSGNTSTCVFSIIVRNLPPEPHDMAVTSLKAPKKSTLKDGLPGKPGKVSVTIQNNSDHSETIGNLTMLQQLVTLNITSLTTNCAAPVATVVPPKSFPVILAPGKKLKLRYLVTIACANDPLASTKTETHADYRYSVTVNHAALDGNADTTTSNDTCPRDPSGNDPGCGAKDKETGELGADVLTDAVVK